jgi:hypothetical protein
MNTLLISFARQVRIEIMMHPNMSHRNNELFHAGRGYYTFKHRNRGPY